MRRIFDCLKKEFVVIAIVSIILFPTYAFLNYAYIPVYAQTVQATAVGTFINTNSTVTVSSFVGKTMTTSTLVTKVGFPIYVITLMTIVGWGMLCWFLPVGMWAYPFDYIGSWVTRPKPMK